MPHCGGVLSRNLIFHFAVANKMWIGALWSECTEPLRSSPRL